MRADAKNGPLAVLWLPPARTNGPERDDNPTCRTSRAKWPVPVTRASERTQAFRAKMTRGKLQLQPQRPCSGGRAKKTASPRRKSRVQRPWRQRRLRHTARNNSTAVALAPQPLKTLTIPEDDDSEM